MIKETKVLVIAEHDNANLNIATLRAITAASQLSDRITVFVVGHHCTSIANTVSEIDGVSHILLADHAAYKDGLPENLAQLITLQSESFTHILAASTSFGKNLMPRVAALLDVAQLSDVIEIHSSDTVTRPIYAGNALVTQRSLDKIQILTIRSTAFEPAVQGNARASIQTIDAVIENTQSQRVSMTRTPSERPDLGEARVVISGGRGLQSAENFKLLENIATYLNAALGASRAAVDAGFAPNEWQVGQTGRVVAPELYIAIGISGAVQHLAGMKDSKIIVAINKDPDAPIFEIADYGLVGDLFTILPQLEQAIIPVQPTPSSSS
ncbi:MAG: electron transfer flavoprotein subunit beta [Gammaproteobacteria bacterium]|nr:electron transfer flavoprotein subunit beta [Gammaproteobacteria bacterium]